MSTGAIIFMALSWTFVLGLMTWAFSVLLSEKEHHDPDGIGAAAPPRPARTEREEQLEDGRR